MANFQNNMRYGRQMNFNNGCRPMPMNNNNRRPEPVPQSRGGQQNCPAEACECKTPQPCEKEQQTRQCGASESRKPDCNVPKCEASEHCKCRYDVLEDLPIAMAYVPWQRWQNVCEPCKAIKMGTIFEDLCKPFLGRGGCNR